MFSLKKAATSATLAAGLAVGGLAVASTPAQAAQCGYYTSGGYSWYNHCGTGNAYIQIDQVIGNYQQCVGPGSTLLRKQDGGIFSITNAFYLRPC